MNRDDLYDWITTHGCVQSPLAETNNTANCIKFVNPQTKGHSYLYTPIDGRKVTDYIVCRTCTELGIEVPNCAEDYKPLIKHFDIRFTRK